MTAANLLPLAPKTSLQSTLMPPLSDAAASKSTRSSLSLVGNPQSLLLYPDALVRASFSEGCLQHPALNVRSPANPLLQSVSALRGYANCNQAQQQVLQQLLQAKFSGLLLPKFKKEIIGMGICVPNPLVQATQVSLPSKSVPRKQPQDAVKRMMMHGNPLRAPPSLPSKIYKKRPVAVIDEASVSTKRRKLEPRRVSLPIPAKPATTVTTKNLTADELEFLEAAQSLHDIHQGSHSSMPSLANSPQNSPKRPSLSPIKPCLTSKALKPPPNLKF